MINELATLLNNFPGSTNLTRCFSHILNLVVKSILQQFDVRHVSKVKRHKVVDKATEELLKLADNIKEEKWRTICHDLARGENGDDIEDDDVEEWVDERDLMGEEELEELDGALQPVRFLLTKVSIIKYCCIT